MIVNNLKLTIDGKDILKGVSFLLNDNKVGLVGPNGAGKTTLLKVLAGDLKADSGEIKYNDDTVDYLKQEITKEYEDLSVIDYIKQETSFDILERKLHELESNLNDDNMEEYGDVLNKFLLMDGYSFDDNISDIMNGLRLKASFDDKIGILSGGEKIKVLLAILLLKNENILLLDEPTNNLDLEAIEWLEDYLKNSNQKMIIVSHDEVFLNQIVDKIFELDNGKIKEYNMNYNDYLNEKDIEYNRMLEEYEKAKMEKDKLKKQVQKAKEWANKGNNRKAHNDNDKLANNYAKEKTNTSNISKLSKALENIEIPRFEEKKPIDMYFGLDDEKGNNDIYLNNLVCGYDTFKTPVIELNIPFKTRLQISGGNGSGKTTLIKTILKEISPLSGQLIIGSNVKVGYISQDTLKNGDDFTVIQYLTDNEKDVDLSLIFTLLSKFNIEYENKDKKYNLLSPGERTRVNLVKLAYNKTNVLILDEVTNHLDKEALELIYELLKTYNGTIISISHNRKYNEILDADMVLNIESGLINYNGNNKVKK